MKKIIKISTLEISPAGLIPIRWEWNPKENVLRKFIGDNTMREWTGYAARVMFKQEFGYGKRKKR